MLNINEIRELFKFKNYELKYHTLQRMDFREIELEEIKNVIMKGKIIEQYPDTKPYPSCLILGYVRDNKPLYVCCAVDKDNYMLSIITVHWMDKEKWITPEIRRR